MQTLFFLSLAFKRLKSRVSLTLLLVFSIALTVGMLSCILMFSNAISLKLMQDELRANSQRFNRPAFAIRVYAQPTRDRPMTLDDVTRQRDWLTGIVRDNLHFPLTSIYVQTESPNYELRAIEGDPSFRYNREDVDRLRVVSVENVASHIKIVSGEPFDDAGAASPERLKLWIERTYAAELGLQTGDRYSLGLPGSKSEDRLTVEIAGLWDANSRDDPFWYKDPVSDFYKAALTTPADFAQHLYSRTPGKTAFNVWYFVFDDAQLNLDRGEAYIAAINFVGNEARRQLPGGKMDVSPIDALTKGQGRKTSMFIILTGFAAPLLGMLVYFIASISSMAARDQRREIALLASRGGTQVHVLLLIVLEMLLILIAAVPLGLLIGVGLASLMSWSVSFLQFEVRPVLPIYVDYVDWRIVGAGLLACVAARLIPAWRNSRVSIVAHERRSSRAVETPPAVRLFLLAILLAVTYYAYRQVLLKGTLGSASWNLKDTTSDPLLLAAPSLFLFTLPLVAVELFSWFMRPVAWLGQRLRSVSAYLGFTSLGRESGAFRAPTYLLVLCLTLGAFYASLARSADNWLIERRQYEYGADLTFKQGLLDISVKHAAAAGGGLDAEAVKFSEQASAMLPISEYYKIPGVAEATWLSEFTAIPKVNGTGLIRLLGVDRLALPKVMYYRRDFAQNNLGELMNKLASKPNAAIVPHSLLTATLLNVGDPLPVEMMLTEDMEAAGLKPFQLTFEIVDVFDYFPTVYEKKPGVLVNTEYLDAMTGGAFPNGVWMKLEPGAQSENIFATLENLQVQPNRMTDLRSTLREDQSRLEYVGIFGLLSICFLAGAILAAIGILVYSLSAMNARAQRFAALRALGLSRGQIVEMVLIEFMVTLAYGILAGAALGVWTSALYVPLYPLTDNLSVPIPPFVPMVDWQRIVWMVGLMSAALVFIVGGVVYKNWRERISEVLRLGAWE